MNNEIMTFTGKIFNPLKPSWELVCIEDIAHALANTCRFGGHVRRYISVAEHSVAVSRFTDNPLEGLLHDATEAYLVDIPLPVKRHHSFSLFTTLEHIIYRNIAIAFKLPLEISKQTKRIDTRALKTEALQFMTNDVSNWEGIPKGTRVLPYKYDGLTPEWAEEFFLERYYEIIEVEDG